MSTHRQHFKTESPPSPWAVVNIIGVILLALLLGLSHYLDDEPEAVSPQEVQVKP